MKYLYKVFVLLFFITPLVSSAAVNINLQYGAKGSSVTELQNFLISKGFLSGKATGNFLALTQKAVISYQRSVGLPPTGFVGPLTRQKVNTSLSSTQTQTIVPPQIQPQIVPPVQNTQQTQQNNSPQPVTQASSVSTWIIDPTTPIDPNLVQWSSSRKLTWNDFKKLPPAGALFSAEILPLIDATANTSHFCEVKNGTSSCTFRIDSFRINAAMDTSRSWVKTDKMNDYRLAHEQIHFDITEVFTRKLKTQLAALVNTTVSKRADSADYINIALSSLNAEANRITIAVQNEMEAVQNKYDSDTEHSLDSTKQAAWASCVANWLNTASPVTNCQMPTVSVVPPPIQYITPTPAPTPVVAACIPANNSSALVSTTNSVGTVTVTSPNGGDCVTKGASQTITWSSSSNIDKVTIMYSSSTGVSGMIASNVPNTGSYSWVVNVGNTTNTQYKIQVLGYQTGLGSVSDISDSFFTVN